MSATAPKKRGRAGALTVGSVQHRISQMQAGDAVWIETTADRYAQVQREWNLPKSRRTAATKDFVIECSLYQAVPVGRLNDTRILVRVERKA